MAHDDDADDGLFGAREVEKMTKLSRMTILRLRQRGRFPRPVHPSPGKLAYRRKDVRDFLRGLQ